MKITQRSYKFFVAELKPFKGSNIEAKFINNCYVVLSYGWYPIFVHKDGQWYRNIDGYSNTTKRQMNKCNISTNRIVTTEDLKKLYNN